MNRTLPAIVRAMLQPKNISMILWADAIVAAVYIRNWVASRHISEDITSFEFW